MEHPVLDAIAELAGPPLPEATRTRLRAATALNSAGFDPWGLSLDTAERALRCVRGLYDSYFRVKTHGIDRLPPGRVMLVPNHSGQVPLDGLLVALAMVLEADPPRIVRGMVERWFPALPFISTLFVRCGQVVGDPQNCIDLLARDQAILVFPEGVRGTGKTIWQRYELQRFGTGFVRIALQTKTPIVPIAVVGAEETYPSLFTIPWLAKVLGVPYVPVTPFFPLLGLAGALPLPVQVELYFGEPLRFAADADAPDAEVNVLVDQVKASIQRMLDEGVARRPGLNLLSRVQRALGGGRPAPGNGAGAAQP